MTVLTIMVTVPAGGALPPHRHGDSAVTACMIKGTILNQMNDDEPFEAHAGDTFSEQPCCHHIRGENNTEEEASFFGIYVIETKKLEEDPGCVYRLDVDMEEKERNGEVECKSNDEEAYGLLVSCQKFPLSSRPIVSTFERG